MRGTYCHHERTDTVTTTGKAIEQMIDLAALGALFADIVKDWSEPKVARFDPPDDVEKEDIVCDLKAKGHKLQWAADFVDGERRSPCDPADKEGFLERDHSRSGTAIGQRQYDLSAVGASFICSRSI